MGIHIILTFNITITVTVVVLFVGYDIMHASQQELERELDQSETWTQLTEVFSVLRDKLKPCTSKLLSDHLEKERSR